MTTLTAWSYSRLVNSEACPQKYAALSVHKSIQEMQHPAGAAGTEMHEQFAAYIKSGGKTQMPFAYRWMMPFLDSLIAQKGHKHVEEKLAINAKLKPTGYFAPDVWCRSIFDFTLDQGKYAVTIDWKSGKDMSDDFTQQRVAAAVLMWHEPVIKSVMMGYYWTQHKKLTKALMTREEIPLFMKSLQPRLQAYQKLHEVGVYPPVAGQHCFYCPVASCKFNKNKKLKAG